ncbi:MAG: hypothetical protein WC628_02370 [Candidatus Omnitrophota bacterium]
MDKKNLKRIIAREGLIFIGFIILGFLPLIFLEDIKRPLLGWRRLTFLFYGIYLAIRFIIWAIKRYYRVFLLGAQSLGRGISVSFPKFFKHHSSCLRVI